MVGMEHTNLGGPAGPRISTLCLGTMIFGTKVGEADAFAILDRFREAGGTFLDTANCYSFWEPGATGRESEELLGRWLASRGCRDEMVVATKMGAQPDPGRVAGDWPRNAEGLSAKVIDQAARGSIARIGGDRVEVLFAHIEDRSIGLDETVTAFGALVTDGSVGVVGVSNHPTSKVKRARDAAAALGVAGYRVVQQRHSVLRPNPGADFSFQEAADDQLLAYVRDEPDLTMMAYSSLLEGAISREDRPVPAEYQSSENVARLSRLRGVAAVAGVTPAQLAYAVLLRGEPPIVPLLGVSSVAQLDEALGALDVPQDVVAAFESGNSPTR
jgi:aryl-alcohol dehydrogenase-like predicted oxidoreductase